MSDKEAIDSMKAIGEMTIGEMMEFLKESASKLAEILDMMDKAASGQDYAAYFVAANKVCEMGEDDLIGMTIVAASVISKIRVKTRDDGRYDDIREMLAFKPKGN